jgi:hypothetical protein
MKHIAIILTLILNACSQNMNTKTFISPSKWFQFEQPTDWIYEDEEGTYLFYNNEDWKGSFRITPLKFKGEDNLTIKQKVKEYVNDELDKNDGAQKVIIGNKEVVHYSKKIQQDEDELQIDYWVFGLESTLFLCSFTIDFGSDSDKNVKKEIESCKRALSSIQLLKD